MPLHILGGLILMSNDNFFNVDLDIKVTEGMADIIAKAKSDLGHSSNSETVNNLLCGSLILEALLDDYPQVEAAYEDYKAKTMAARGGE
jgi:hypothetical protein